MEFLSIHIVTAAISFGESILRFGVGDGILLILTKCNRRTEIDGKQKLHGERL